MSLGRLLRRASSKASDLLTLSPGGGGGPPSVLDREIIYSKNNVCVHPPEGLQGLGQHHPGYLCLYMEKDELLGATLILAWVPNSRIQRQDEEALRYITPESSPVRKAPRLRGRPAPPEPRPALMPRDEDILAVAQSLRDAVHVSPSREDGEKLAGGPGTGGPLPASHCFWADGGDSGGGSGSKHRETRRSGEHPSSAGPVRASEGVIAGELPRGARGVGSVAHSLPRAVAV
ncbi:TBC1 domain family member 16-like [Pteropus alecto]|uniref:TBC1 domain family member 16-like n=1 Tax=Pteropus alecto TaxID=9402 RepID=UPI0007688C2E|nr:TBC1 domain family member 16-like [Pteropus alecto]